MRGREGDAYEQAHDPEAEQQDDRQRCEPARDDRDAMAATAAAVTATAVLSEWAAKREGGSVEPSRTAAIGGTRVARRAGTMLASTVIAVPSASEMRTVRSANTILTCGSSPPFEGYRPELSDTGVTRISPATPSSLADQPVTATA